MQNLINPIEREDPPDKWKIVWQDEFNYSGIPDPEKWVYETGHLRNKEKQYYTRNRKENINVENGNLVITGRKELFPNEFYKKESNEWLSEKPFANYTSASIHTKKNEGFKYGRIEVRAKLPTGKGMWPAIWMMGSNRDKAGWPECGEIDIMEYVLTDAEHIHGSLHYPDPNTEYRTSGGKMKIIPDTAFHTYAIEWNKDRILFIRDGSIYHKFLIKEAGKGRKNPFRKPFYLKINLAMGAGWPGPVDDRSLPQNFTIDYVRFYKKN